MVIYVVKKGDTIYDIGKKFNVPYAKIIKDNVILKPESLVVGQALVILGEGKKYTVKEGDTLYIIARDNGVTIREIMNSNPQISYDFIIQPGQIINIPQKTEKLGNIEVNGYSFPNINKDVLKTALPNLTYLSIFSYEVLPSGDLITINDEPLIQMAKTYGVAPLMVITNIKEGSGFSSDIAKAVLTNVEAQDKLIDNILNNLKSKGYYGLDIDFEYIYPQNKEDYNNFLKRVIDKLKPQGYTVTTALAPKIAENQPGLLYEAHDYAFHGANVNHVIIMTYEWGYTYGEPRAVAPINEVRKVLDYAVTEIPRKKIFMGIPNYGYDWTLPYVKGTAANALSNVDAVELAARVKAEIQYDNISQAPYFTYYDGNKKEHVVWFEDARSIDAKLRTAKEYGLGGVSYWTIGRYFPQNWLVLNELYNIIKI